MEQQRNIYVAGNYIAEQHIETQILHADNVYNHAPQQFRTHLPLIDVEDVMPSAKSTTARPSKRPNAHHFLETRTFIYRYNNARPEDSRRLPLLFQFLTKEHHNTKSYLEPETKPDDFYALFNGELSDTVVTWTGSKQDLYYFIKRLKERNLIEIPQSLTIWSVTQNHFSDRRGNYFEDMRNQHNPKTSLPVIERLIDILDPAATDTAELDDLCRKIGGSFGGK
ncbi:MAG: hypothetical protein SPF23_01590 [Paludibacteraceae bacterium]|nr:hypothetical protein [Paludibacteraceae bacterium]